MRSAAGAVALITVVVACALGAGACREPYTVPRMRGAGHTTPQRGGTFRYAFETDVRALDPHVAYDEISLAGARLLFDTLVDYSPGTAEITPSLAERWDIADSGREFTFHLRPGVRFHNGRLLVADDVRKSFERMLDPARVPCPGASFYHLIVGFDDFQAHRTPHVPGIEVLDPGTVRFRLTQPDQTFLNTMAMVFAAPIPVEVADAAGRDGFSQNPIGTGPFRLERWETNSRLVFARNSQYWRPDRPYLDRIVMETGLARHLQFMRFQRGDLDHLQTLSLTTMDYLWIHEQPAWRPYVLDAGDIASYGLSMNTELRPWNNVHVRRAVAHAIDRESLARARNNRIRPLAGLYPPGLPGFDPHLPGGHYYDVALARREMALAGFPNGLPDEQELWITDGDGGIVYGELMQHDLRQIGIRIRLRQASFAVFLENTERRGAVGLALAAWSMDYPDPANFAEVLFHSRAIQPENSQNQAFYANPELDTLLDRARTESDRPQRIAMYQQAERIIVRDAPWAFLYYRVMTEVNQPYVKNYVINPVNAHDFRNVWLDQPIRRATRSQPTRDLWNTLSALALPWWSR